MQNSIKNTIFLSLLETINELKDDGIYDGLQVHHAELITQFNDHYDYKRPNLKKEVISNELNISFSLLLFQEKHFNLLKQLLKEKQDEHYGT